MMKKDSFGKSFCPGWCSRKHTDCNHECEDPAFYEKTEVKRATEEETEGDLSRSVRTHTVFSRKFRI